MIHAARSALLGAVLGLLACATQAQQSETTQVAFSIEQQPMLKALNAWAQQAKLQVIWPAGSQAAQQLSPRVVGRFAPREALQMLLKGSSLEASMVDAQTVEIKPTARVGSKRITWERGDGPPQVQVAQASSLMQQVGASSSEAEPRESTIPSDTAIDEVVVTGSHIRGIDVGASPVQVLTRQDIDRSGVTTTSQLIRSIAANFGGGVGVETGASGVLTQHGGDNSGFASSANLRGLGSDATLVLLNGHRLPVASEGYSADISVIPVAIIERVEVLKDGASAIYGSDAVAGVVNIITKRRFDGAQTTLVGSGVTSGSKRDYQISQLLGGDWSSGNALVSYTNDQQDRLSTKSRRFSQTAPQPTYFVPDIKTQSVYSAINQQITEGSSFGADALWSQKRVDDEAAFDAGGFDAPTSGESSIDSLIATASVESAVGANWHSNITALYATDETRYLNHSDEFNPEARTTYHGNSYSFEPRLDGPIFKMPAGFSRMAIGAAYRSESFKHDLDVETAGNLEHFDIKRTIRAVYGELFVPIISEENRGRMSERLELTIAGRYEHYSDFGSTTNPKYGVLWSPFKGLAFRGTYATSFRAPQMAELQQGDALDYLLEVEDPLAADGTSVAIYRIGGNPDLRPQTATTFNLGLTIDPASAPGLHGELTYFDIQYKDRIQQPGDGAVFIQTEPTIYGNFLERDPLESQVNSLSTGSAFRNYYGPFSPSDVSLIADARRTNLAALDVNGIDLGASFTRNQTSGAITIAFDASYLLRFREVLVTGQPSVRRLDTPYYPAALRLRGGSTWSSGAWSISGFLNYVGSYTDRRAAEGPIEIAAWPTFDTQIAFTPKARSAFWSGMALAFTVTNALDRDPPFVLNTNSGVSSAGQNYDATNASPFGRYISLRLEKSW